MMRLTHLILLSFAFGIGNAREVKASTPTFSISEERSIDGSPKIHVVFQNGVSDTMILSTPEKDRKTLELEDSEEELEDSEEELEDSEPSKEYGDCRYFGRLENEPDACVAVTGCLGSEDVEMTILSKNIQETPAFLWTKEGSVKNIIMKGEYTGINSGETNRNATDGDSIEYDQSSENQADPIQYDHRSSFDMRRGNPPAGMLLKLQIRYGKYFRNTVTGSVSNRKNYIYAGIHHAQAYYCHSSLGSKIELSVDPSFGYHSDIGFYTRKKKTGSDSYQSVDLYDLTEKKLKSGSDLMVYVGRDYDTTDGYAGVAPVGSVCGSKKNRKWSLNEWADSTASFGHLVAHEIGHNFGMSHDFKTDGKFYDKSCNCQGVESYRGAHGCPNILPAKWSTCSKNYFFDHYKTVASWCLQSKTVSVCDHKTLCDMNTFNDGICDDKNNIKACAFDGGDCCDRREPNWNSRCKLNFGDCSCKDTKCFDGSDWCNDGNPNRCTPNCHVSTPTKPPCWTVCKRVCDKCVPQNYGHPQYASICDWVKKHNMCDRIYPQVCGKESCGDLCRETCA